MKKHYERLFIEFDNPIQDVVLSSLGQDNDGLDIENWFDGI